MTNEVPALPVVIPVALVVLVVLLAHLRRRGMLTLPRAVVAGACCVYAAGVVANTVFPIFLDSSSGSATWKVYVTLFQHYDVADAVMNVLVFVPVGVLVPLLAPRASWWRVVAVAAALSLSIELTQLVTGHLLHGGHVADVNDLVFNVVGSLIGLGALIAATRMPAVDAVVERFRWREAGQPDLV